MKRILNERQLKNIICESIRSYIREGYADTNMGPNPMLGQGNRQTYGGNGMDYNSNGNGDRNINTIGDFVWALNNWFKPYAKGARLTTIDNAIQMFSKFNQNYKVKYYQAIQEGMFGKAKNFFSGVGKKIGNATRNVLGIENDEQHFDRTNFAQGAIMASRCKKMQRFIKSMFYKCNEMGEKYQRYQGILRQLYNVIGSMRDINPYRYREDFDDEWGNGGANDARNYRKLGQQYAENGRKSAIGRMNSKRTKEGYKRSLAAKKGWDNYRNRMANQSERA